MWIKVDILIILNQRVFILNAFTFSSILYFDQKHWRVYNPVRQLCITAAATTIVCHINLRTDEANKLSWSRLYWRKHIKKKFRIFEIGCILGGVWALGGCKKCSNLQVLKLEVW